MEVTEKDTDKDLDITLELDMNEKANICECNNCGGHKETDIKKKKINKVDRYEKMREWNKMMKDADDFEIIPNKEKEEAKNEFQIVESKFTKRQKTRIRQNKLRNLGQQINKTIELKMLSTVEPAGVKAIKGKDEWEEIEFAVDSGASETVINEDMAPNIDVTESTASKRGVEYEVANGVTIPNEGEKRFEAMSEEEIKRKITAQVCDVNKALLSVKKVVQAGNRVVFDASGSYIEDLESGEKMWLREAGGMYMLKMWVRSSPF